MMRHIGLRIFGTFMLVLASVTPACAAEVSIRPFLIDETVLPRDSVTQTVTIKNDYPVRKAVLYATVNEISVDADGVIKEFVSPVMTDRTDTVTSWIEVTRGRIEVDPGATKEVSITLRIHPYAKPGVYHAYVGFVQAANRPEAEKKAMAGDADGVIIKITVADQRTDSMRIAGFSAERFITGDDKRSISVDVQNMGDLPSAPTGEIIFYDSRGVEIASAPVNESASVVAPGETVTLKSTVPVDKKIGRFKANLALTYGANHQGVLQDTTFFYMMSPYLLMAIFGGIMVVTLFVSLLFRRVFLVHDEDEFYDEVTMYVRDGHNREAKDHDINLKNNA